MRQSPEREELLCQRAEGCQWPGCESVRYEPETIYEQSGASSGLGEPCLEQSHGRHEYEIRPHHVDQLEAMVEGLGECWQVGRRGRSSAQRRHYVAAWVD